MSKLSKTTAFKDGAYVYTQYWFMCPGCDQPHAYFCENAKGGSSWEFNGDMERPSFTPSLLNRSPAIGRCHLFVTDGKIHYCGDCTHELAGKTVDMPPLPDWMRGDEG